MFEFFKCVSLIVSGFYLGVLVTLYNIKKNGGRPAI